MAKVLVTGSRYLNDYELVHEALTSVVGDVEGVTLIHGAAPGADTLAARVAESLGWDVLAYPAEWDKYGKKAGPLRNQQMVDAAPDVCVAFPKGESRGTRNCMSLAADAGIQLFVFET